MRTWPVLQAVFLVAGSVPLVYLSRKPLLAPGSHGFYRFFAWEAILALGAWNLPVWFRDPFRPVQLASWVLLVLSIYPVVAGVKLLRVVGMAGERTRARDANRIADANYAFENTSQLVRVGIYRFIRHPLYASLLYLAWGIYLKRPASLPNVALVAVASVSLWLTARADERECRGIFGDEYDAYVRETRMFVPYLF